MALLGCHLPVLVDSWFSHTRDGSHFRVPTRKETRVWTRRDLDLEALLECGYVLCPLLVS